MAKNKDKQALSKTIGKFTYIHFSNYILFK